VVGIGASTGGLDAFMELLRALPADTGMAFVVIQHLARACESQLPEILSKATTMPVVKAEENQRVEPNHVYVIPENTVMVIQRGTLHLGSRKGSDRPHYPIDVFLESLAAECGTSAVGVVLSGTGSDGTQGLRAIKSRFGTTFCQDEESAKYSGMPHSAIETGVADFVLPPLEIAGELGRLRSHPYLAAPAEQLDEPLAQDDEAADMRKILVGLKRATRVDFSQYKHSTIRRRLGRRLVVNHLSTVREYVEYLNRHPGEIHELYRDILISVTSFFREPEMFHALEQKIQNVLARRSANDPFRLWIPGCATGEEVYSLTILVSEITERLRKECPIQAFGTDISDFAIERARSGVYPEATVGTVSPERLQRFFSRIDSGYRIKQQIRECCVFSRHDLTVDPPFSQMDLVSCRNVFIYLSARAQRRIFPMIHYSLKPDGLFVLGSAETTGDRSELFAVVDSDNRIYSKRLVSGAISIERGPEEEPLLSRSAGTVKPQLPILAQLDLESRAARILSDLYAPSGVLINDEMTVLHFHGEPGFYLERGVGDTATNLLRMVRDALVFPVRKAVDAALATRQPAHEPDIEVTQNGETRRITLTVIPVTNDANYCMVLFEERPGTRRVPSSVEDPGGVELNQAQRELAETRDYLRRIIEQHSATTEELRAANEEARSGNEELQSTNEDLRTAKEQLQSSNEELNTINDELKHSNSELQIASNDLSNILNAAHIPIFMAGMDLRLRRFTPAAERLLGMTASDTGRVIGSSSDVFASAGLREMLANTLQTLNVQHKRAQAEDGRWFDIFARPYRTIDNRIEGGVVTFIDVDTATRALDKAERARAFAEGTLETVQHPLLVLDAELKIVSATSAFYRMFSLRPGDTIGRRIDAAGNGRLNFGEVAQRLDGALDRDIPFRDFEIIRDIPNAGTRRMRLNARRTPALDGQHWILLAIEDVTDRQEAAEIQYRRIFESATDGIVVLDAPSGTVADVNPFFVELSRYSRGEMLGKRLDEIPPFDGSDEARQLVSEVKERGTSRHDSMTLKTRDGRELVVEIIANGYWVKERSLIQLNVCDVTEKRRYEEDLRRSNLDLQQFAFAASHDLQEPLRTITSYLQLFRQDNQGKFGAQSDAQIQFISSAADRMRHLVLDLLGFSQVARSDLNFRMVSMEAILSGVMLSLQMAIDSSRARITFDHLPEVFADEHQISRLLQNLITNSIKYRSEETPHIHISAKEMGTDWAISVQDNGLGLDMKYADQIFTVFRRLHGREYPGTGIGLAICRRIVERHAGRIWVESEPGTGSTFFFTLPRKSGQA
jgi:two-component system CheB/CheR fusion protein